MDLTQQDAQERLADAAFDAILAADAAEALPAPHYLEPDNTREDASGFYLTDSDYADADLAALYESRGAR
ncbi:MAG: hypothetical protein Q8S73_43130 [Deltaproteobacteria bacterium]|nr:hypothetical protein [Myxococcales bacterium]MDP3220957.1 hypothetical protein [Deltaproteobacteria bacterium]